jgi:hypothetical protein
MLTTQQRALILEELCCRMGAEFVPDNQARLVAHDPQAVVARLIFGCGSLPRRNLAKVHMVISGINPTQPFS